LLLVALLGSPARTYTGSSLDGSITYWNDVRYARLTSFLAKRSAPAAVLAADFLASADRHGLDWRLLPAISIVESGGGMRERNNNILGWNSGRTRFPSPGAGIHHVALRLATSGLYRDKNLDGKLRTYNPSRSYAARVKRVMRALGPAEPSY
jgi:hypothetical protein